MTFCHIQPVAEGFGKYILLDDYEKKKRHLCLVEVYTFNHCYYNRDRFNFLIDRLIDDLLTCLGLFYAKKSSSLYNHI